MGYRQWLEQHGKKHACIVKELDCLDKEALIAYFRYENLQKSQPDFCPLFAKNIRCHDMENLNCYLCACPYFRFNDEGFYEKEGKKVKSYCAIEAKDAAHIVSKESIHLDCSACTLPHKESFIRKHFSRNWFEMMQDCNEA